MAKTIEELRESINNTINQNGTGQITGQGLNVLLNEMADVLSTMGGSTEPEEPETQEVVDFKKIYLYDPYEFGVVAGEWNWFSDQDSVPQFKIFREENKKKYIGLYETFIKVDELMEKVFSSNFEYVYTKEDVELLNAFFGGYQIISIYNMPYEIEPWDVYLKFNGYYEGNHADESIAYESYFSFKEMEWNDGYQQTGYEYRIFESGFVLCIQNYQEESYPS